MAAESEDDGGDVAAQSPSPLSDEGHASAVIEPITVNQPEARDQGHEDEKSDANDHGPTLPATKASSRAERARALLLRVVTFGLWGRNQNGRVLSRLSPLQLSERLRLNSSGLVEEIHATAVRQNQLEDAREARLDAKAGGLLGTAGLSLTVAFTFGGLLLQHPEYLKPLGAWCARAVLIAYVLALVLGLAAVIAAVAALFVSDEYQSLSDDNVFNEHELTTIDESATDKDEAQRRYRRFITIQLWSIYGAHFAIHQRKASIIKKGQGLFLGFLVVLIVTGAMLTYAAFEQYSGVEREKPTIPTIDL